MHADEEEISRYLNRRCNRRAASTAARADYFVLAAAAAISMLSRRGKREQLLNSPCSAPRGKCRDPRTSTRPAPG